MIMRWYYVAVCDMSYYWLSLVIISLHSNTVQKYDPFHSLADELGSCAELICQLVYNDQGALPLTKSPTFVNRMKTLR